MWKQFFIFLVVFPGAILIAATLAWKKWVKNPLGNLSDARARKAERERLEEARKALRRLNNGGN